LAGRGSGGETGSISRDHEARPLRSHLESSLIVDLAFDDHRLTSAKVRRLAQTNIHYNE
jgi:hypothetical protein